MNINDTESIQYLFVHKDINNWIINGSCFGEESRNGCQARIQLNGGVRSDQDRKGGVRRPADEKGNDHNNDHSSHLSFRFPCSSQPALCIWHL